MTAAQQQLRNPFSTAGSIRYGLKFGAALAWGMPFAAAGIICGASIIFIPVVPFLFAIAGWPLSRVVKTRTREVHEWRERDRPLSEDEGGTPPWAIDDDSPTSDGWSPV
jgi:hypothetical protein